MSNILVLCLDAMRFDHLTPEITPNLIRIAKEGIFYNNCLSGGTATLESMPIMLCGNEKYNPRISIMNKLRHKGYFSILIHSNPLIGRNFKEGWNFVIDTKENTLARIRLQIRRLIRKYIPRFFFKLIRVFYRWLQKEKGYLPHSRAREIFSLTIKIIEKFKDKPLFVWVHLMDPHIPYYPQKSMKTHEELVDLNDKLVDAVHGRYKPTTKEIETYKLLYRTEISEMDEEIGQFYSQYLTNELLFITSDHGDEFGEKGQFSHHSNKFIPELQHVPLIIIGNGKGIVEDNFSHYDFSDLILKSIPNTPKEDSN